MENCLQWVLHLRPRTWCFCRWPESPSRRHKPQQFQNIKYQYKKLSYTKVKLYLVVSTFCQSISKTLIIKQIYLLNSQWINISVHKYLFYCILDLRLYIFFCTKKPDNFVGSDSYSWKKMYKPNSSGNITKNGQEIINGIGINREYKGFYVQKNKRKSIQRWFWLYIFHNRPQK
jgi:hypothetical protein